MALVRCASCGTLSTDPAAIYCEDCGRKLPTVRGFQGEKREVYVCERCGTKMEGDAFRFCEACGGEKFLRLASVVLMKCLEKDCGSTSRKEPRCSEEGCDSLLRGGAPVIRILEKGGVELYHIEALLGRGGLGAVYRAHDQHGNIRVLKEMRPAQANGSIDLKALLKNEAIVMAKLKGLSAFCQSYGYFEYDGNYFIVLELVPGKTLQDFIEERKKTSGTGRPFSAREAYYMLMGYAAAVQQANEHGVILRDMKAANIMWEENSGSWKIIDFGLAYAGPKYKDLPARVGTPGYAPGEQWKSGATPTPWWDVHALCALGHYLVTGYDPDPQNKFRKEDPQFYFSYDVNRSFTAVMNLGLHGDIKTAAELIKQLQDFSQSIY